MSKSKREEIPQEGGGKVVVDSVAIVDDVRRVYFRVLDERNDLIDSGSMPYAQFVEEYAWEQE
jgi:hypothetical protein